MKRIIIALCIVPFAIQSMEENHLKVTLRGGNEWIYIRLPESLRSLDNATREATTKKMQKITNWHEGSDGSQFIGDLLANYRDYLLAANPDETIRSKMSTLTQLLFKQHTQHNTFVQTENTKKLSPESYEEWKKLLESQTKTVQELAALSCVQAFATLEELKSNSDRIEKAHSKP